jgi:hypothetical protein
VTERNPAWLRMAGWLSAQRVAVLDTPTAEALSAPLPDDLPDYQDFAA